jgi:hypothetical protein
MSRNISTASRPLGLGDDTPISTAYCDDIDNSLGNILCGVDLFSVSTLLLYGGGALLLLLLLSGGRK